MLCHVANGRSSQQLAHRFEDVLLAQFMLGSYSPSDEDSILIHAFDHLLRSDQVCLLDERLCHQFANISKVRMLPVVCDVQLRQIVPQALLGNIATFHENVAQNQIEQGVGSTILLSQVQHGTTGDRGHNNIFFVSLRFD